MAGYLEEYGIGDQRREKVVRWLVISGVVLVIAVITLYFVFRTWPAKRQVHAFLANLTKGDYQAAYREWGCAQPCRDYPFNKFLEDWGPKSAFANAAAASIKKTRYCDTGVIVTLSAPQGGDVPLWYERRDSTLGFSPWPVCVAHIPAPVTTPAPAQPK